MGILKNKVAIIVGAYQKVGSATARLFLAEGARVLLVDQDEEALKNVFRDFSPKQCAFFEADITDPKQAQNYIQEAVKLYDGLHILFCSTVIFDRKLPKTDKTPPISLEQQIMAIWAGIKYSIPEMAKNGEGSIMLYIPPVFRQEKAEASLYLAKKQAIMDLMRQIAPEAAKMQVRVNTIHWVLNEAISKNAKLENPEAAARLALFLGSDESRFITGSLHTPQP